MSKITPCLWFNDNAEEAARFYVSVFKRSRLGTITRYGEQGAEVSGRPKGSVMTATFEIDGQEFVALNGGPPLPLMKQCRFKCIATRRKKWIIIGMRFPPEATHRRNSAAG